jgi:LuxR family maltose regulon positive regulatory protein
VLISAPAGFGKTTLAAEWLRAGELPAAWLSLDQDDNAPARFWSYVSEALGALRPGMGRAIVAALRSPQPLAPKEFLAGLVNELSEIPQTLALVLDDYHVIENTEVHSSVELLVDNLPSNAILVIASRSDPPWPLARKRALGNLVEVRATDLRFTPEEAAAFLNQAVGLELTASQISELESRTEGWIAGLQLAALSMRGQDDLDGFIRAFGASDRFVLDYLVEEVLNGLPPATQDFLLQTSILPRMSAELCDAATERNDGRAMLIQLEVDNAFLVSLDNERRWYRYHHLFADLLQSMAQHRLADRLPDLHLRASIWFEQEGAVEEAIAHALRGGNPERAADLIQAHGSSYAERGQMRLLQRWFSQLPESLVQERAPLALWRAWLCLVEGEDPEPWWQIAMDKGADEPPPPGLACASFCEYVTASRAVLNANLARNRGEPFERAIELAQGAYALVQEWEGYLKSYAALVVALTYAGHGDTAESERWFALADEAGKGTWELASLIGAAFRGERLWSQGQLRELEAMCQQLLHEVFEPAERAGESLAWACYAYLPLGRVRLEWNKLDQSERLLTRGIELADAAGENLTQLAGRIPLSMLRCIQGRFDEASELIDQAVSGVAPWKPDAAFLGYIQALRVHVWVWRARVTGDDGWLRQAVRWADALEMRPPDDYSVELQSLCRTRIAQYRAFGKPDLSPLLGLIDGSIAIAEQPDRGIGFRVEMHALKALALDALGRRDEALASLARALMWSEPERFVRHILDHGAPMAELLREAVRRGIGARPEGSPREARYAGELLQALETELAQDQARREPQPSGAREAAPAVPEILTAREMDILRYLDSHLSTAEIAQELYISANTARFHVKNIYDKLGVHSRDEALVRARDWGLLQTSKHWQSNR